MKKITLSLLFFFHLWVSVAGIPYHFNYQGILKNENGEPRKEEPVVLKIRITRNKEILFEEEHRITTSPKGLFSIKVGQGENRSGSLEETDWKNGDLYIQTLVDDKIVATSALSSVPYALYAADMAGSEALQEAIDRNEEKRLTDRKNLEDSIAAIRSRLTDQTHLEDSIAAIRLRLARASADIDSLRKDVGRHETMYGLLDTLQHRIRTIAESMQSLQQDIASVNDKIGIPYNLDFTDPLIRSELDLRPGVQPNGHGFLIPAGTPEKGNTLLLLMRYKEYQGKTADPVFDVQLAFNGTSDNTFRIEILASDSTKIDEGTCWYDLNNGMLRINYRLKENCPEENVWVKITAESETGNEFLLSYIKSEITGYTRKDNIDARLSRLETASDPTVLTSPSGKKYQLIVNDNGTLSTTSYYFSKLLVISHSFGIHGINESLGWYGNWGMAAESQSKDFPHQLLTLMRTVTPSARLTGLQNLGDFEINHNTEGYDLSKFDYINTLSFDIVVVKLGENAIGREENFASHFIDLLDNHVLPNKRCKVFIASQFAYSADTPEKQDDPLNREFAKIAEHYGTRLIMINKNGGIYGDMYNAVNEPLPSKPDGSQPDKETEVSAVMLKGHPGNTGHKMIADAIWEEIRRVYEIAGSDR